MIKVPHDMLGRSSHSSYHPPKFGVHRPCQSGDNVFYLSSDHVVDVSRDLCVEFSFQVTTLLGLASIGLVKVEI